MELTDRGRVCCHAWISATAIYVCSLPLDHGGDEHEDHLTNAPAVWVWLKAHLIDRELINV